MTLLALSTAVLALVAVVSGLPSPPKFCDVPTFANYSDLPGLIPGGPAAVSFVPSPFKGLTYGKGWGDNRDLLDNRGKIVQNVQTLLRGPADIGIDTASGVESYQMKYFDWYAGVSTVQGTAQVGANATLLLQGKTDAGASVAATCEYTVPLGTTGTPLKPLPVTRCTLPDSFTRLVDVNFKIAGALATLEFVTLPDLSYVLHKSC